MTCARRIPPGRPERTCRPRASAPKSAQTHHESPLATGLDAHGAPFTRRRQPSGSSENGPSRFETETGGRYEACRYLSHVLADDGSVALRSELAGADGRRDRLDWKFAPMRTEIAGREYMGFTYGYALETTGDGITRIDDRSTWEIGARAEGVTVITQNAYNV